MMQPFRMRRRSGRRPRRRHRRRARSDDRKPSRLTRLRTRLRYCSAFQTNCRRAANASRFLNLKSRHPWKPFGLLAISIAPDRLHAERRSGVRIPGVRRHERDSLRRNPEFVDGKPVHARMRLEHAHSVDRKHVVQGALEAGRPNGVGKHACTTIGQDRGRESAALEILEDGGNLVEASQRPVQRHEPRTDFRRVETERFESEVERVPGNGPEVCMPVLRGT